MAWSKPEWNTPMGAQAPVAKKTSRKGVWCAIAAGVVAVVGLVLFFALKEAPKPVEQPAPVQKPKPAPQKVAPIVQPKPAAKKPAPVPEKKVEAPKPKPEYVKKPGQMQLPDGQILTFPPPKEGQPRKVYAYGHLYECDHLGNFKDITPRKLFHTAFEGNFFALAQEGKPFIPAFLTGLDEDKVKEMLTKPYQPIGDETDEEKKKLEQYDLMRKAALDYMANGGKFDDFVNDIAKFEREERQTQAMCLREVMTLVKQGKLTEAKTMLQAADKLTTDKGYKPIRIPAYVQKAFDEIK